MDYLAGYVHRVVYQRGGFYVLDMHVMDSSVGAGRATARGSLFGLLQVISGMPIKLLGEWLKHHKYGRQLSIQTWEPWAGKSRDVVTFLQSCIPGYADGNVAHAMAERGIGVLRELVDEPQSLLGVLPPLGEREVVERAIISWQSALAVRDLSEVLSVKGLSIDVVQQAVHTFGSDAAGVIRGNPFRLMEVTSDFPKVDSVSWGFGIKPDDPRRVGGAAIWALREGSFHGHLYRDVRELPSVISELFRKNRLIPFSPAVFEGLFAKVLEKLFQRGAIVRDGSRVYFPDYYTYERDSAKILGQLLSPADLAIDLKDFLERYERSNKITLSADQRTAVELLARTRVLVLTGLPGTGKTLLVRTLVRLFDEARVGYVLMAPTGIAAKRLSSVTGKEAFTVHRLLRYNGATWGHGADNPYVVDAVVVDETSMMDQELLDRLLTALRSDTLLILVGDDAQLPSVGPGNVLRELVACPAMPTVRLTQIFRQAEEGAIVTNSHAINKGEMPNLRGMSEFRFIPLNDEAKIARLVVQMARKLKDRKETFQVMSPRYKGVVGVTNLNLVLRESLNPAGPREWQQGDQHFRLGDRVMVIRNDYQLGLYNGDMGKLIDITKDNLTVSLYGSDANTLVEIPCARVEGMLRLAYAISVHKSQGCEFNTVILPIVNAHGHLLLQRNLLYTAVTRAREKVWLIGEESAIQKAVSNNRVIRRNTALGEALLGVTGRVEECMHDTVGKER